MTWCLKNVYAALLLLVVSAAMGAELPKDVMAKLASDQYEVREAAYSTLKKWSQKHIKTSPEMLYKAWSKSQDPEVKTRCFALMKRVLIQRKFGKGMGFVGIGMNGLLVPAKAGEKPRLGVRISFIRPGTPAEKAELMLGDVIVAVDALDFSKLPITKLPRDRQGEEAVLRFGAYIRSKHPDDVITLHLLRGGKMIDKKVTLIKRPRWADMDPFGRYQGDDDEKKQEEFLNQWLEEMNAGDS